MNRLIAYFLMLLPITLPAQNDTLKDILSRLTGTRDQGKEYFQLGGYAIVTETVESDFSAKKRTKLKKRFGVNTNQNEFSSNELNQENFIVFKSEKIKEKVIDFKTVYFIKSNEKEVKTMAFHTNNYRDSLIEKAFIKMYLNRQIPNSVFIERDIKEIDFAGKMIKMPSYSCQMMNLRSIQCPDLGQMNWALHTSLVEANSSINTQFEITKSTKLTSISEDEIVDVFFENQPIKVRRIKLRVKLPKLVMGGSNTLIIYYVAAEIRGFNVSCVLSHYDFDRLTAKGLPLFLSEVMSLNRQ
jgi:hypothetical protein